MINFEDNKIHFDWVASHLLNSENPTYRNTSIEITFKNNLNTHMVLAIQKEVDLNTKDYFSLKKSIHSLNLIHNVKDFCIFSNMIHTEKIGGEEHAISTITFDILFKETPKITDADLKQIVFFLRDNLII